MIPEKVTNVLNEYGLQVFEFEPGSTLNSELAAQKLNVAVGQIAKSIVFIGKDGRKFLVVCPGDRKVSSSKFKACTGTKGKLATGDETFEVTGFYPGGVCPFGVENAEILIDRYLSDYQIFYPAAGTDSSAVPLNFDKLLEITKGKVCDLTELKQ